MRRLIPALSLVPAPCIRNMSFCARIALPAQSLLLDSKCGSDLLREFAEWLDVREACGDEAGAAAGTEFIARCRRTWHVRFSGVAASGAD